MLAFDLRRWARGGAADHVPPRDGQIRGQPRRHRDHDFVSGDNLASGLDAEERAKLGVGPGTIRVSVGIEAAEDIVADFAQALSA